MVTGGFSRVGTDLLVQLREGLRQADLVVDVKQIPSMTEIRQQPGGGWRIGAAVACQQIESDAGIASDYPAWRTRFESLAAGRLRTGRRWGETFARRRQQAIRCPP